MSNTQQTPEVLWAQRSSTTDEEKNYVYLTIGVPDVPAKSLKLDITPTKLTFTGTSESKKTTYHVELEFYAEIDPENSKTHHTAANIQMVLRKKDMKEEYWPRLLKDSKKAHFLRTDFDKWVDEDEQNEAPEDDYMNQFGGAGGMGGMGGMGEDGGFGGIDFSKLGGGAGGDMPGMEGLGGGDEDEDDDDDDEDMPDLAEPEDDKTAGKGKSKIEEIDESK
ncbi:p23 chaperone protein wos2 [Knufia obscura]|uniref:P23 chaperone protein wos2 n=2 Tax=Knufia TaxID=430999 RepID=A0AAN8EYM6_9EURO|nr:p23 chaperone protein wos2 [Knufia obscura]KAK5948446.1 p23 chaperone protein wos2 [Knufia fluminis]